MHKIHKFRFLDYIKAVMRSIAIKTPINCLRAYLFKFSNVHLGVNNKISPHAKIDGNVVTGKNVVIGANTAINNSWIGDNSHIEYGAVLFAEDVPIIIGNNTYIGIYAVLEGFAGLKIGDHVHIAGPSVGIWTHTSIYECLLGDDLQNHKNRVTAPIEIGNNVWIGGKVTIYPGISIGHHSIVLPNSVVNENIPPYTLVGGVPMKIIKKIDSNIKKPS